MEMDRAASGPLLLRFFCRASTSLRHLFFFRIFFAARKIDGTAGAVLASRRLAIEKKLAQQEKHEKKKRETRKKSRRKKVPARSRARRDLARGKTHPSLFSSKKKTNKLLLFFAKSIFFLLFFTDESAAARA
ncbi:hypothetical protein [Pandoravirus japonicus]|uniref:Uncharacterized protein n=1 Tax=Pandoravirus japonicus TaxID=2823154 RepID=A0A811BR11_9VIRU|nr:hypothetical protein [Pandoravirus japonicus]